MNGTADSGPARLALVLFAALAVQAAVLLAMGQPPICTCGTIRLFAPEILSADNSQQITDWYTPSHVIHGFLFYALIAWLRPGWPLVARLALAAGLEVGWEILENSPPVIERYREQALAVGYSGDSVLNSVSDTLAMAFGFWLARRLPVPASVALVLALEIGTAVAVRDNLTLNVLQLLVPIEAVSRWQAGG